MKKQDKDGRDLLAGNPTKVAEIREVIYGSGKTLKEKKKEGEADQKKRLDEGH